MGEQARVRLTFGKLGRLKYIGHLDLTRTWERVLRRAGVGLEYTRGFNPRPRMQFASALPLGITSECELLDLWLNNRVSLDELPGEINSVSPKGLVVYRAESVPLRAPALQSLLHASEYKISFPDGPPVELEERVAGFLSMKQVMFVRGGKELDIRPMVIDLEVADASLVATLMAGEHGNLRPDELLSVLGLGGIFVNIHRLRLIFASGRVP